MNIDLFFVLAVIFVLSQVVAYLSLDSRMEKITIKEAIKEHIEAILFWPMKSFGLITCRHCAVQGFLSFVSWLVATGLLTIFLFLRREINPLMTVVIAIVVSIAWFYLNIGIKYMLRKDENFLRYR